MEKNYLKQKLCLSTTSNNWPLNKNVRTDKKIIAFRFQSLCICAGTRNKAYQHLKMSKGLPSIQLEIAKISSSSLYHKDQAEKFRAILDGILKIEDSEGLVEGLKVLIESIVHENVSLVISRQIFSEISCYLPVGYSFL